MAVERIADDRMADRLQVHADLVGATGLQAHAQQRRRRQRLRDLEVRDRLARGVGVGRVARAVPAVAADRCVDGAGAGRRAALDERQVLALDAPLAQLLLHRAQNRLALGRQQQAAGVAVQAVHDAAAVGVDAARGERLRQRAGPVAGRGMHDQAGRLVDDEQRVVLVGDVERDGRPRRRHVAGRRRLRLGHLDDLAGGDDVALGPRLPVDGDQAGVDQALRARAAAQRLGQHVVEPLPRLVVTDRSSHRARRSGRSRPA